MFLEINKIKIKPRFIIYFPAQTFKELRCSDFGVFLSSRGDFLVFGRF